MRYRSRFDVEQVIKAAQVDLPSEQMKIFLLAIMAGLRRNEIDKLEWSAFRWSEGVIRVEATHHFQPKSEDSIGDVDVDPELLEIFRGFLARAKGTFVIESSNAPRLGTRYAHYRCQKEFEKLNAWLRAVGVVAKYPAPHITEAVRQPNFREAWHLRREPCPATFGYRYHESALPRPQAARHARNGTFAGSPRQRPLA